MNKHQDVWYTSQDGLRLYARDYANPKAKLTLLCMHGLTRNSADFEEFCDRLQGRYRLVAVDQRGRGKSGYDSDPSHYHPGLYVQDMFTLINHLQLQNLVLVGTSLGGLMAIIMASLAPAMFRGVILNDVGCVVEMKGIQRIQGYVGRGAPVENWSQAAAQAKAINGAALPDYSEEDWLRFAHKLYREDAEGVPVLNYDPAIAQLMTQAQSQAVPPDLWPAWEAMGEMPCMVIRGVHSDILSTACVDEMQQRKPGLQRVEIPNRGHTPMLDEPAAIAAIDPFLAGIEARQL